MELASAVLKLNAISSDLVIDGKYLSESDFADEDSD